MTDFIIKFRLHVVSIGFLGYLLVARAMFGHLDGNILMVGLCFYSLLLHVYSYNMCTDVAEDAVNFPRHALEPGRRAGILVISAIFACAPLVYILRIPRVRIVYGMIIVTSLIYSGVPGFPAFRLKRFALSKLALSLGSYFMIIAVAPAAMKGPVGPAAIRALSRAVAPIMVCVATTLLIGDIRDVSGDRDAGHKTIPVLIGVPATVRKS